MISIGELIAARQAERGRAVPRLEKAKRTAPVRQVTPARSKPPMNRLGELYAKKETLREQFAETIAAEKELKAEAKRLQEEASEQRRRTTRRRMFAGLGAAVGLPWLVGMFPAARKVSHSHLHEFALFPAGRALYASAPAKLELLCLQPSDFRSFAAARVSDAIVPAKMEAPCPTSHDLHNLFHTPTFSRDIARIFQVRENLGHVKAQIRSLRKALKNVAQELHGVFSDGALDLIHELFLLQIPWFLVHGSHPPETQKPPFLSFIAPGSPCLTV